jgi:tetraacyldisaccharide 4'-kinase
VAERLSVELRAALVDAWYRGAWWLVLLRPLEWAYRAAVWLRRKLYAGGILRQRPSGVPVVVVGNLCVGGTGKTPVVIALVEALADRGIRAGVVGRGYGGKPGMEPVEVTRDADVSVVGDEALMIVQRTGCPCVIHPDRARAVAALLRGADVDLVISDDGLQHYAMARDLEIVMYDAALAFGNGRCLPAGPLREPLSRLQAADFVLARGFDPQSADVVLSAGDAVNLHTGQRAAPGEIAAGGPVRAVAGIASPQQFADTLRSLGLECELHAFPDHHAYTSADIASLGEGPVIMTEKDAVKLRGLLGGDAWYLPLEAALPEALIARVAALVPAARLSA